MTSGNINEGERSRVIYAEVIARCWQDSQYRLNFLTHPNQVLTEAGMSIPEGVKVEVLQNTDTVKHAILPHGVEYSEYQDALNQSLQALLPLPTGVQLNIHQNTAEVNYLVLPSIPSSAMPETEIAAQMGAGLASTFNTAFNVETAANAAVATNAAAVSNAVGATNVGAAVSAVVVLGVVVGSVV